MIELQERCCALQGSIAWLPDTAEQRGLPVGEREAVVREHNSGALVPAEPPAGDSQVEGVTAARAEPVERSFQPDGAYLDGQPAVDGRVGQRVGGLPARGAVLERDGRIEAARLKAKAVARARIGAEQQVGLGQAHGASVLVIEHRGVEMGTPYLAERLGECEAGASPLAT